MGIMQMMVLLVVLYISWGSTEAQTISEVAVECYNTTTCPCCDTQCPSDGSGQCGGNCTDGYHGGKCYNKCPKNCARCVDAKEGVGVSNCTLCKDGYYSTTAQYQCQSNCSQNCKECKNGTHCTYCLSEYHLADQKCIFCKFGDYFNQTEQSCQRCNILCSACDSFGTCLCYNGCKSYSGGTIASLNDCKITSHSCAFGCRSNFTSSNESDRCDKCVGGMYGLECNLTCSANCFQANCERLTGNCYVCNDGFYGEGCNSTCPKNCESQCDRVTGQCMSCNGRFYGTNCSEQCAGMCKVCNHTDGSCTECEDGFYGDNCSKNCFENCQGKCDMKNGSCACMSGYMGPTCEIQITTTIATVTVSKLQPVVTVVLSKHVGPTVGGTLSGVVIIVTFVIGTFVLFRRRRAFKYVRYDIDFDSYKLDARLIDVLEENDEFDTTYFTGKVDDTKKPCGKIPVKELTQYVETHDEDFYQEEFLKLPRGLIKSFDDAKKEENVVKNRYTGIYPYDEHRVRLQPPGSDFINACYIDGFKRKKEYIASLGPTRKAMEDFQLFWRMVWQEKSDVIVMVTNFMEGQSMKCEQYWPDIGTSSTYGEITVTSQTEDVFAEFVVRDLKFMKSREERVLHHFHYTAWPDKRVPDDVTSLIEFRQKVRASASKLGGPVIVHCSAGIGRTGTYIALDILIHQGKAQKSVGIFEWVTRMREQRTSMVQTWQQYEYLHRALVHALTFHCDPVKQPKIELFLEGLNDKKIARLFKQLDRKQEKPIKSEQESREMNKGLEGMNRDGADIPGSMYRPFLHLDRKFGEYSYINALFLNSYTVKNRFLVCQTPLPDTVRDFLTLIIQESCSCIVSMNPPGLTNQTIGAYYPVNAGTVYTHPSYIFDVEAQDLDANPSYNLRRLTIHFNKRSGTNSRTVYHFQCQHWPQGNKVPDVSHFLQLVQDVENIADRDTDRGPVLVHCLNAAERSGLYCAVSNLVQKIRMEGEVSVVNTLRQVKFRRPLAIPHKEQYMFCYRCVYQFVKSQNDNNEEAVYGNID